MVNFLVATGLGVVGVGFVWFVEAAVEAVGW
jgi:hypothetical protein